METERLGKSTSLHWLLMEPILNGSRLGSSWDDVAMISELLMKKGVSTVRHLLELVGAKMEDVVSLARRLEVRAL